MNVAAASLHHVSTGGILVGRDFTQSQGYCRPDPRQTTQLLCVVGLTAYRGMSCNLGRLISNPPPKTLWYKTSFTFSHKLRSSTLPQLYAFFLPFSFLLCCLFLFVVFSFFWVRIDFLSGFLLGLLQWDGWFGKNEVLYP